MTGPPNCTATAIGSKGRCLGLRSCDPRVIGLTHALPYAHLATARDHPLKNLLTDISGVHVGHADDAALASGVPAVVFDKPVVAAIDVRGGGPGTREGAALDLGNTVDHIHGIA